jgi:hypothetical protein
MAFPTIRSAATGMLGPHRSPTGACCLRLSGGRRREERLQTARQPPQVGLSRGVLRAVGCSQHGLNICRGEAERLIGKRKRCESGPSRRRNQDAVVRSIHDNHCPAVTEP